MLIEREIAARRERAQGAVARILARPDDDAYGDYQVRSFSNKTYRVAMRGPGLFENYCSCPDFAVNTLATCKHIEALLLRLRRRHGQKSDCRSKSRAVFRERLQRFARTGTWRALSRCSSAVTRVRPNTRAVATRKRSAGSRWGSCTRAVSCATW